MGFIKLSKKSVTVLFCLSSFGLLAKVVSDYNFNSANFLNDKEIVSVKSFDSYDRQIASNQDNSAFRVIRAVDPALVDGKWEIKRIVFSDSDQENLNIDVQLKWIGNGVVRMYKDDKLQLDNLLLSFITEQGTIALVNIVKDQDGISRREIIEAKRVNDVVVKPNAVAQAGKASTKIRGVQMEEEALELALESVYLPQKPKELLVGNAISGEASISDGTLDALNVTIENDSFELVAAKIEAGGVFTSELSSGEEISGRFAADGGKGRYQIRLFQGKYKDAVLKFVSKDVFEAETEARQEQEVVETVTERGEIIIGRVTASEPKIVTKEEMNRMAEKYGFKFKSK